ncbi:conserved hypothetical protein [Burkholderia sp. 8Y]|uniref:hypothetical protein n=1 Tax=Burkholderia sp. 8Y TaxID=2653133 RepID=UPI0012F1AD12|nr:hypothetical protein [Burkholderia sp. 8Y]VXB23761.1 conserved hypothetical protein [Burkholderia sp. 8Y]
MSYYLPIILIWVFFATLVCVFIHGAKKAKRSMDAIHEAKRGIQWPVPVRDDEPAQSPTAQ